MRCTALYFFLIIFIYLKVQERRGNGGGREEGKEAMREERMERGRSYDYLKMN